MGPVRSFERAVTFHLSNLRVGGRNSSCIRDAQVKEEDTLDLLHIAAFLGLHQDCVKIWNDYTKSRKRFSFLDWKSSVYKLVG